MKTVLFVLLSLIMTLFSVNAESVMVDDDGNVSVVDSQKRPLVIVEKRAYDNPGEEIPVDFKKTMKRVGFFHGKVVKETSQILVYDNEAKKMRYIDKDFSEESEVKFLHYVPLVLAAIVFLTIFKISLSLGKWDIAGVFTILAMASILFAALSGIILSCMAVTIISYISLMLYVVFYGFLCLKNSGISKAVLVTLYILYLSILFV